MFFLGVPATCPICLLYGFVWRIGSIIIFPIGIAVNWVIHHFQTHLLWIPIILYLFISQFIPFYPNHYIHRS
jgi:uncharacterized membrane protein YphA (DoxX/SURF4 family)